MGQDRIFHQSDLWENVHKQIEKYRNASEVKMRKEGRENQYTQVHARAHAHTSTITVRPTYKAAIYLHTITVALRSEVSLNTRVSPPVKGKKRYQTTSFTNWLFDLSAPPLMCFDYHSLSH